MPHKCVHCSAIYKDSDEEILKGCSTCGSKFFFYLTEDKLKLLHDNKEEEVELSEEEKQQIEQDVRDIAGIEETEEAPVILDFESVKIIKPGKYLLDVANLFSKQRPLIYKWEDGKYFIDLDLKKNKK